MYYCTIATASNLDLDLRNDLAIDEIPKEAFAILGEHGIIRAANCHECSECAQPYKQAAEESNDDDDSSLVKMVVVDGIVVGPKHCAYENCTTELDNNFMDVFAYFTRSSMVLNVL